MKRIIAALTALTVIIGLGTSCQKEMENRQETSGNGLKITATIADNGTKVSYQEDGTTPKTGLKSSWQKDDIIIGFDDDGNTYGYKVDDVNNDGVATLVIITESDEKSDYKGSKTTDPTSGTMYMFYAPGTTPDKISSKSLTVGLARQAKDTIPTLMTAQATVTNGSLSLRFSNQTAIIGVKAPKMVFNNKLYTSLALSGSAGLNTEVKFDLDQNNNLQASYQTEGTITKELNFTPDSDGKGPDVIYIVACPATQQNLSFKFNDTEEYFNVENVAIAANNYYRLEAPDTKKQTFAITVADGIQNGTITTSPSGSVAWGETVTVTATPATGYELATLTYNDGESHDIKDVGSFTMPQEDVTVSGTFKKKVFTFTVSSSKTKVVFAPGNLYAKKDGSTWKWGFYDKQYKFHSESMKKISSGGSRTAASGDTEIDLFCWGYSTNSTIPTANTTNSAFSDWGTSNLDLPSAPYSGGWRTLDKDQWTYLLNTRTSSMVGSTTNARYLKCAVKCDVNSSSKDVYGLMIFPDEFTWPSGAGNAPTVNNNTTAWNSVPVYTTDQFTALEAAGVVFLPAAGERKLSGNVSNVGSSGFYWSSTAITGGSNAYTLGFGTSSVFPAISYPRENGRSVRLVSVVQ